MEKIKRCRKCGARLLEHEKRCPVCGTPVGLDKEVDIIKEEQIIEPEKVDEFIAADKTEQTLLKSNESAQNYWRSKKIWAVFIVLIVVTTVMRQYVINNPIKLAENDNSNTITNDYSDSKISINKNTGKYSQATNINYLGISYVNDDAVYLMMNSELLKYDRSFNNRELVLEQAVTVFSEDEQWYYYLDENNDYIRMDKKTKAEDILLKNVYYVHNLGDKVYYQNDSDGETIHCLELETNQDHKISDEVSYSIVVDEEKGRIFYINKNNELVISKNKITAPTDALLKEKSINVRSNGLARDGSFDSKLVKSVKFAEKIRPISCRNWFYGFTNLVEVKNIENLYTDKCEDMYFMFYNCSSLKEINLKYFETSNVTDMRCMFSNCSSLKYLDLSSFDISKSKDCNYMMDTGTSTTIKANPDSIIYLYFKK